MLLRPRKFIYKNIQKRRSLNKLIDKKLIYGTIGLLLTQPLRINSRQIFRYKLFLKKAARKKDKTSRMLWFNAFPYLPVTKKVLGSRMGKGKGKLDDWGAELPAGIHIVEFKNLRLGRSKYFLKQLNFRLGAHSSINLDRRRIARLPLRKLPNIQYSSFW